VAPELSALPNDIDELKQKIVSLYLQIDGLKETILVLQRLHFGPKSERGPVPGQGELFGQEAGIEEVRTVSPEEAASYRIPVRSHNRRPAGRKPLPRELPELTILHDVPEADRMCCERPMKCIGEERLEQLGVIPPQFYRLVHVRPKYGCRVCDGEKTEAPVIRIAPAPEQLIPKSIVTPELLSWVLTAKCVDGLPFYRLEKMLHRYGVEISRETMCDWMQQGARRLLPLVGLLRQEVLRSEVIQADETTVQVLGEPSRSPTSKCYLWAYRGGRAEEPVLYFEYSPSRGAEVPLKFLNGYQGVLQTDGYDGYEEVGKQPGIVHAASMAHARRKFVDAAKVAKGKGLADYALREFFRPLYAIEAQARELKLGAEARLKLRTEQAKPILEKFKGWLDEKVLQTPPSLRLGKAISYARNLWPKLTRYAEDGRIEIDTNLLENAIRPFCVGRRAWLFHDSPEGAKASAVLHGLIQTAKVAGLEPYHYLRFVFTKLLTMKPDDEFAVLLPHRLKPQDIVLPPIQLPAPDPGG
jgi:transposase